MIGATEPQLQVTQLHESGWRRIFSALFPRSDSLDMELLQSASRARGFNGNEGRSPSTSKSVAGQRRPHRRNQTPGGRSVRLPNDVVRFLCVVFSARESTHDLWRNRCSTPTFHCRKESFARHTHLALAVTVNPRGTRGPILHVRERIKRSHRSVTQFALLDVLTGYAS